MEAHPNLSILITTVRGRELFLNRLLHILEEQIESNSLQDKVEVVVFKDNFEHKTGYKRNKLKDNANGEFISFIDDDDIVSKDYCSEINAAIENNPGIDYVGFSGKYIENGKFIKPFLHSLKYNGWQEDTNNFYRDLSHLNPIRKKIAKTVRFSEINYGEDASWVSGIRAAGLVKKEYYIDKYMYFYLYRQGELGWHYRKINMKVLSLGEKVFVSKPVIIFQNLYYKSRHRVLPFLKRIILKISVKIMMIYLFFVVVFIYMALPSRVRERALSNKIFMRLSLIGKSLVQNPARGNLYRVMAPLYHCARYFRSFALFKFKRFFGKISYFDKTKTPGTKSILCPTKSRPKDTQNFIYHVYKTAVNPEKIEILFYIDSPFF